MKTYAPNYYQDFHCLADKCRHSCCIGWEIDIDDASCARYEAMQGEFAARIQNEIQKEDGVAYFRLTDKERCPFLNQDGLCDMILTVGEDALCQICKDHPRFRNVLSDRMEIGIGLCCEEAARIILQQEGRTEILLLDDDQKNETLWEEDEALLAIRENLFAILQDRQVPLPARIKAMLDAVGASPITEEELPRWHAILSSLERLDPSWDDALAVLVHDSPKKDLSHLDTTFEKMILYFLYRHIANACDAADLRARVRFSHLAYRILRTVCEKSDLPLTEAARLYSSEIEYSEENTETLLRLLQED